MLIEAPIPRSPDRGLRLFAADRSLVEVDRPEHVLECGDERGIRALAIRACPGQEWLATDVHDSDPQRVIRLETEAALSLIGSDRRTAQGSIQALRGFRGQQRSRDAVHGGRGHGRNTPP